MLTQSADTITAETFPGSPLQCATRLLGPSTAVRIVARLRRGVLDRGLSDGAEPDASVLTAARAAQLSSASTRTRIAAYTDRRGEVLAGQLEIARARLTS
jgi:hypothetical protein